jgi:ABC-2 type transport system permease protein
VTAQPAGTSASASAGIGRWRLEWLRLMRTRRWIALVIVFLLVGFGDPLLTRYLGALLTGASNTSYIHITVTKPQPSDGMISYFSNITTVGTLVVVVVAGLAFAVRAIPPLAVLYLTHIPSRAALLVPRLAIVSVAALAACGLGSAAAAYETSILLGTPAPGATAAGVAVACLGTLLAVSVTFAATAFVASQVAAIAVALVAVLVIVPLSGLIPGLASIGPAAFLNLPAVLQNAAWTTDDWWATAITIGLIALLVAAGFQRARRWEL